MSWAEFRIKSIAWRRMDDESWRKFRRVAYNARVGSHLKSESLPRTEVAFMQIGDETYNRGATEVQKEAFKAMYKQYLEEVKRKNGITGKNIS